MCEYEFGVEPLTDHEDFDGTVCTGCLRSWQFGHAAPVRGKTFPGLSATGREKVETSDVGYEYNGAADRRREVRERLGL